MMIAFLIFLLLVAGTAEYNQITHLHEPETNDDVCQNDTSKYTIVGTAGGLLHAIDSITNEIIWSLSTG